MRTLFIAAASALFFAAIVTELSMRLWPDDYVALLVIAFIALFVSGTLNLKLAGLLGGARPATRSGRGSREQRGRQPAGNREQRGRGPDKGGNGRQQKDGNGRKDGEGRQRSGEGRQGGNGGKREPRPADPPPPHASG